MCSCAFTLFCPHYPFWTIKSRKAHLFPSFSYQLGESKLELESLDADFLETWKIVQEILLLTKKIFYQNLQLSFLPSFSEHLRHFLAILSWGQNERLSLVTALSLLTISIEVWVFLPGLAWPFSLEDFLLLLPPWVLSDLLLPLLFEPHLLRTFTLGYLLFNPFLPAKPVQSLSFSPSWVFFSPFSSDVLTPPIH